MKIHQVAIQVYTLRDHLKTPKDITATLKKVRAIGYQAVEVLDLPPLNDAELKKVLEGEGLVCTGKHESSVAIQKEPSAVADRLDQLGCQYAICSYPAGVDLKSQVSVNAFIEALDHSGKVLAGRGKVLCYHNHGMEFTHLQGRSVLERIYEKTNPSHLQAELDTYWVQYGGGEPVEWCRRLKGRLPLLHIKDYGMTSEHKPYFAEIGQGGLRWKEILATAEASGCKWFVVEQDICPGDPFDSLKMSFDYIQSKLVS